MTDSPVRCSADCADLYAALAAAQIEIQNPEKTKLNPHFKNKYADIADGLNAVRPVLAKHGIALLQVTRVDGEYLLLTTRLAHKSGQWLESDYPVSRVNGINHQQMGSANTYARRFSLFPLVGVAADEDDDGNTAGQAAAPKRARKSDIAPHDDGGSDIPIPTENPNAKSAYSVRKGQPDSWNEVVEFLREAEDPEDLKTRGASDWLAQKTADWPALWLQTLRTEIYMGVMTRFQLEPAQ